MVKTKKTDFLIINQLPKRTDSIYQEIEEFADYELTHCIAYEMGLRNQIVQQILFLLDRLSLIHKQLITNQKHTIKDYIKDIRKVSKNIYKSFPDYINLLDKEGHKPDLFMCITLLTTILKDEFYMFYDRAIVLPHDLQKLFNYSNHIQSDREISSFIHNSLFHKAIRDSDDIEDYKENFKINDGFVVYQGAYAGDDNFDISKVFTNFKRPIYEPNQTQIAYNLSLPKKEFLAYMSKIKDDYDNKNSIQNIYELLGKELKIAVNDLKDITAKEWADSFFIYDTYTYLSLSKKKIADIEEEISIALTRYNGVKIKKTDKEKATDKKNRDNSTYKLIPYEDFMKKNSNYTDSTIGTVDNEKRFLSLKSIQNKYKFMVYCIDELNYKRFIQK